MAPAMKPFTGKDLREAVCGNYGKRKKFLVKMLALMKYTYYVCSTNPSKSNQA
jgi:hypothetical protein